MPERLPRFFGHSFIEELKNAGVDVFVIGSGILKSPDIGSAINELKSKILQ